MLRANKKSRWLFRNDWKSRFRNSSYISLSNLHYNNCIPFKNNLQKEAIENIIWKRLDENNNILSFIYFNNFCSSMRRPNITNIPQLWKWWNFKLYCFLWTRFGRFSQFSCLRIPKLSKTSRVIKTQKEFRLKFANL